ncbi:DNA polymerase III subunit alpha [Marinilabilia salmonicolor]|uniref:DNA polymerase III subunit alpha n=1 Tax=Marinilabilia salmonicolor TaxID=989 RepID=A0A368VE27_9BACT|nr:DNA polymerase III subunit alpha [Marinilabilia salmonicolor]RCW39408.1 DNA polymerase III alpha subunit [Marinilabilia salmonicolor]
MDLIPFTHLHVHSQYSILDGAASVNDLVTKAKNDGMKALALTDHGTMFGIKEFFDACKKNDVKPILGCETYVAARTIHDKTDSKLDGRGDHLILLAKNRTGYRNLLKLISIANVEGFYYKPRIDKNLLEQHSEGLIVTSACIGGEVPQKIMAGDLEGAKESVLWFKRVFGDDYYLELQRHPAEDPKSRHDVYDNQVLVNEKLLEFSKELGVKVIAANDVHFTNAADAEAHDLLICLNTGKDFDDENRMRYTRQEWFKTTAEMNDLFKDVPEALQNTAEIADKVEVYELNSAPIMPFFAIPTDFGTFEGYKEQFPEENLREEFGDRYDALGGDYEHLIRVKLESDYLTHLAYEGAKDPVRYGDPIPDDVKERLDFELNTIKTMGFPGYFLIVQDFINAAREMGVLVGPGRGSAAGAAVSYCVGITNIDPIKHDLLFERFLNPDRISMPDVDIDFDDDGRQLVLDWVTEKYGRDKVAHICTFGTMAARLAIRDVGRVLKLPLPDTDKLAKLIPERPGTKLANAYQEVLDREKGTGSIDGAISKIEADLRAARNAGNGKLEGKLEVYKIFAERIREARSRGEERVLKTMELACRLEGSVRQTGVHACGVLIGRDPLEQHIPLIPTKEENLMTTQYDGRYVEAIGLLKMDFLGLKTLSIIKETLENIKLSKGIDVDVETLPPDDKETFELFARGDTTAIFQFESPGMKKHLRALEPNRFEDLVAMNALYRPGPMEYIPDYIDRKHGRKEINYDHPMMESYLKDTYGITVFQEQVMLLSRALGGFTRGESDSLRKAMGKKLLDMMAKLKDKFHDGCLKNEEFVEGCKQVNKNPEELIEKIWKDWEAFASYAFNKSHSVCYAYVAYQTGYLKAHYPAEFMSGVLSRNLTDITKITTFMEECRRMGLEVLGPDVNESFRKFTVNAQGAIRFGMAGIKGVGAGAVEEVIRKREEGGPFKGIFDFVERVNLQTVNKKNFEGLAASGAFDNLDEFNRAQYFAISDGEDGTFIERLLRYGNRYQADKASNQVSLFGAADMTGAVKKPTPPNVPEFTSIEKLGREKELIGIYLSAHPLDRYKLELKHYCNMSLSDLDDLTLINGRSFIVGGMVTGIRRGVTRMKENPFAIITIEDYSGSHEFPLFGRDYTDYSKYHNVPEDGSIFLLVKGKVQPKKYRPEELEAKINSISFLNEVLETQVQSLSLNIALDKITDDLVNELANVMLENRGHISLRFNVFDPANENYRVQMLSRSARIDLSHKDVLQFFDEHPELQIKLG